MAKDDKDLIAAAQRAYGLKPGEVMGASLKDGVVTLVTIGAHKVRWKEGDEVKPLSDFHAGRVPKKPVEAP